MSLLRARALHLHACTLPLFAHFLACLSWQTTHAGTRASVLFLRGPVALALRCLRVPSPCQRVLFVLHLIDMVNSGEFLIPWLSLVHQGRACTSIS